AYLAAQRREHRRKLPADDAAADHGEPPRYLLQLQDLVRVDRELRSRERNPRHGRPRLDDDVLRLKLLPRNVDDAFSGEASASFQRGDAAGLQQAFNTLDELVDHLALPFLRGGPVEADVVGDQAEGLPRLGEGVELG